MNETPSSGVIPGRAAAYMLASSLCLALMSTGVGLLHRLEPSLSTAQVGLVRSLVNLLILLGLSGGAWAPLWGDRRPSLWLRGLLGGLALLCNFAALRLVGVGEASFLFQTQAAWVALLAPWLLGERTSGRVWWALVVSMGGMLLLCLPHGRGGSWGSGELLGVSAGFFAGCAYVTVRKAGRTNPPFAIVFYFTGVAAVVSAVLVLIEGGSWPREPLTWLLLLGVGVTASLAQLWMTRAYQLGPSAPLAALSYSSPLLATLLSMGVLGQWPTAEGWLGMMLILGGGLGLAFRPRGSREGLPTERDALRGGAGCSREGPAVA